MILISGFSELSNPDVKIKVNVSQVRNTIRGGMGASWHAISKEFDYQASKYKYPPHSRTPRGSAYGGNPPVTDVSGWNQIKEYASWLGLNFVRVEFSQRMYMPEKDVFDWDNEEMQALFLILDWCQQNDADVFFQQMWGFVEWNSFPGVHPLMSAPRDLDAFVNGIATLLEYLVKNRGYTCIKYFCMVNEPPGGPIWGSWWHYGDESGSINDAWKKLKEVFDERGITIPISGPGWTDMPGFNEASLVFAPYMGAIDIHSYHGVTDRGEANLKLWADYAHAHNKPFFLTEYGNFSLGYGRSHPAPKSFEAALSNVNDVIRAFRAGADGVNRWSFTNRGNLDGQWQLIHTYDREKKEYLQKIEPENEAFYGFSMISRFLSKYSSVVECLASCPDSVLMSIAMLSPEGELSVFILNPSTQNLNINLEIASFPGKQMNVYQVTKEIVHQPKFKLNGLKKIKSSKNNNIAIPAKSITTVSSYLLKHNDKGIIIK